MSNALQPRVTGNIVGANVAVSNTPQKVLFVGQMVAAGSATGGNLYENIQDNSEDTLFGAASQLAGMIRAARKLNPVTRFDAIPLDDNGSGVAATGTIAFTGTITTAGTISITIGSELDYTFDLAVSVGDTATVIGDALVAAITANLDTPFTASNTTGTVTITAANDGTLGNFIGLVYDLGDSVGVTCALTAMASGATDPTLTGVFDVVGNNRYQGIVWPYFADTSEVRSFLDARFNVTNEVLDGVAITSSVDTLANHLTRLNALNSQSLVDICDETTNETAFKGPAQMELSYIKAAQFTAIRAYRLTADASISQFVITTNGPLDSIGGPALASKPYFNTPMPDLPLYATGRGFTDTEIEQLHDAGGTVIGNNSAGNTVVMGEVVTTYKTDTAGNADISFKYLNYVDTISNVREYYVNNYRTRFAQSRLTEGDIIAGRDMANALVIQAYSEQLYQDLSGPNFVLLQAGENALVFYKENFSVVLDLATGKATIQMVVPLVTQLREITATIKISFSTSA